MVGAFLEPAALCLQLCTFRVSRLDTVCSGKHLPCYTVLVVEPDKGGTRRRLVKSRINKARRHGPGDSDASAFVLQSPLQVRAFDLAPGSSLIFCHLRVYQPCQLRSTIKFFSQESNALGEGCHRVSTASPRRTRVCFFFRLPVPQIQKLCAEVSN